MALDGQLFEVTDLAQFAFQFLLTDGQPTQGFDTGFARAQVRLIVHAARSAPSLPTLPIIPGPSFLTIETESNDAGEFSIKIPDELQQSRGHLVIRRDAGSVTTTIPGAFGFPDTLYTVQITEPIYRTSDFLLSSVDEIQQRIFVSLRRTADELGVGADRLRQDLAPIRADQGLDSLHASILEREIRCTARKSGGGVEFAVKIQPNTTHELGLLVSTRAEDFVFDLPFGAGLCVNTVEVERSIRPAVRRLSRSFSDAIIAGVTNAIPPIPAGLPSLESVSSLTVTRVRFPVTGTQTVPTSPVSTIDVPVHSIVPDLAIGFPRGLITNVPIEVV